ncbi:MAG: VPS10 domain-containing protein, partial [Candidatus Anammoxibacter sp.]
GIVNDIAIDPTNADIIYAGTNGGKIFKSFDNGEIWQEKSDGLDGDSINVIAIDPINPAILYAGASESLYKSEDAGESWKTEANFINNNGIGINSLVIDPLDTDIIYVGSEGFGMLKSVDGGKTWNTINNGLDFHAVREDSLVINPVDPNILYAVVGPINGTEQSIFKTTNGGQKWEEVNNGLFKDVQGLAIDPDNPDTLYAGTLFEGVFKTTNGGANWFELKNSPHTENFALAIDNLNPDVLYVGNFGLGVFMSRDGGDEWTELNIQLTNRSIFALKTDPVNPTTIYAGTNKGVFRFTHSFSDIKATPNVDGVSIDIEYKFNKETGIDPLGFNMYRSTSVDGDFEKITDKLLDPESTSFNDQDFLEGVTHVYKMTVVDKDGETLKSFAVSAKPRLETNPDFSLQAIENEKEVVQGDSVPIPLIITGRDNFEDEVFLTVTGLPENVTTAFFPESGVPPLAVTLDIKTDASTPTGNFEITMTAVSGEKTVTKTVKLSITETDSNESSITQTVNAADIRVGGKIEITGEIIPLQIGASITTAFVSPDEETSRETAITDASGKYSVIKQLNKSGAWKITTSWDGNEKLAGASSQTEDIFASQAVTTISMVTGATSETESGDTLILTGNVSPNPGEGK